MTLSDIYQAGQIKRRRRTNAQVEQLEQQIIDVLQADHPQSIRHCFYRMTDPRLPEPVEKTSAGYNQVQDRITRLRRAGRLPYGWISDSTRRGWHVDTFNGAGDFLTRVKSLYRADLWSKAESRLEVWAESRSIAGVVQADCEELAVSLYPCGGFPSITLAHQAAESLNEQDDSRPVFILYIGDYDPAGVLIDVALERELRKHLDSRIEMSFFRLAVTEDQIEKFDLPRKPRNLNDKRSPHVVETVEAEAIPAGVLRGIMRRCIESMLPEHALSVAKAAEESEQAYLTSLARAVRGTA